MNPQYPNFDENYDDQTDYERDVRSSKSDCGKRFDENSVLAAAKIIEENSNF